MKKVESETLGLVLVELRRIRRELQRLEDLLMEESLELNEDELEELLREARDESIEWVKLEDLPKLKITFEFTLSTGVTQEVGVLRLEGARLIQ